MMTPDGDTLIYEADAEYLRLLEPTEEWFGEIIETGGEVVPVGPFRALLHSGPGGMGFNYAAPIAPLPDAGEVQAALAGLRRLFVERDLPLMIEFNEPLFPGLAGILEADGLRLHEREPLMFLAPADFRPSFSPQVQVRFLAATDPAEALAAYQSIFFSILIGHPWEQTPQRLERFRREIELSGNRSHALAVLDGRPVGTGFISSSGGVAEINRVATLTDARRRGVAATLTSFMLHDRFTSGDILAWLTATGEPAQRLYQMLGFRVVGDRLYYRA